MRYLPVITAAIILSSCGHRSSGSSDSSDSMTDSVADQTLAELPEPIVSELPDTPQPTAADVTFRVIVKDSTVSAEVDPASDLYSTAPGALTFRGNLRRDADFGGRVKGRPEKIVTEWVFETATDDRDTDYGRWGGGTGWTGQPLFVEWPAELLERFKQAGVMSSEASPREIIVGSLASEVYFIDYETGKASRRPLSTTNPIKGTVSLDPTLNGNLYVGQGVPAEQPFGAMTFNLMTHTLTSMFDRDPGAERGWGAYDSSAIRTGRFLFRPGENGTLYKWLVEPDGTTRLHSLLRYRVGGSAPGMEASMSVYRNYGYVADNHGNILCINLSTLRPIWHYTTDDDSDATPVVTEEDGRSYVYVCSEIDRQGEGTARFAKLDALTGKPVWERRIEGQRADVDEKHFDGGFYASPLPGQGNASGLIFANCVLNTDGRNGQLMAFDRATGATRWATPLSYYSWSSPVGFLNEDNEMFILTGDCAGNLYIVDAATGRIITRRRVGNNFESSPVVTGNTAVVGSRGRTIYKVSLQ